MIKVIATIEIEPGRRDAFLAEFRKIIPKVRAEQGCIEYGPWVDIETNIATQGETRADVAVIVEKWETLDDLENHLIAPHMMEYRKAVGGLVKGASLQILGPADEEQEDEDD